MGSNRRWVALAFTSFGVLLWVLLSKFLSAMLDIFAVADWDLQLIGERFTLTTMIGLVVALSATLLAWRNQKLTDLSNEVVVELKKVTWPNAQETRSATVVVIITVFIMAFFLGIFDIFWSSLMDFIYPSMQMG